MLQTWGGGRGVVQLPPVSQAPAPPPRAPPNLDVVPAAAISAMPALPASQLLRPPSHWGPGFVGSVLGTPGSASPSAWVFHPGPNDPGQALPSVFHYIRVLNSLSN